MLLYLGPETVYVYMYSILHIYVTLHMYIAECTQIRVHITENVIQSCLKLLL